MRSQVNGTSHKAACTRASSCREREKERERGACTGRRRRRSASGVAAAAAAGAAKASRGEGGMHTILDSIVVKRGATGGQVQVHRRCRYACSMPRTTRRTPYGADDAPLLLLLLLLLLLVLLCHVLFFVLDVAGNF